MRMTPDDDPFRLAAVPVRRRGSPGPVLAVDWQACRAHGLCAELLPELVDLDEWGYPIVVQGLLPSRLKKPARRAVAACPTLALRIRGEGTSPGG